MYNFAKGIITVADKKKKNHTFFKGIHASFISHFK